MRFATFIKWHPLQNSLLTFKQSEAVFYFLTPYFIFHFFCGV